MLTGLAKGSESGIVRKADGRRDASSVLRPRSIPIEFDGDELGRDRVTGAVG